MRPPSAGSSLQPSDGELEPEDCTAVVVATAPSGEVVVEARFNEDEIQPRFVLPIVQQRIIPVRAFVVKFEDEQVATDEEIRKR